MGKTSDLMLIASDLKSKDWEVFFFSTAAAIPKGAGAELKDYALRHKNKKIAVIVDEVASKPHSPLFVDLLKSQLPNVLTVGAAVPRFAPTNITAVFRKILRTSDLVLKESDEDVLDLIEYWKGKEVASPEMVVHVSIFLLNHCGGHVYPVLAFMEYVFTHPEAKEYLADEKEFRRHFFSQTFVRSTIYRQVCSRCFDDGMAIEPNSAKTVSRVLSGREEDNDIGTLTRMGWWDSEKQDVLSALLLNACLNYVKFTDPTPMYLDQNFSQEQNLENLIIEGLYAMEPHELTCATNASGWPVENALSFNWAFRVKARFINVHLEFQKPFPRKLVDFYVNGNIDAGLEMLRNATQTVKDGAREQSQDIDEHLERFLTRSYNVDRFALLNFAMNAKEAIVLPRDDAHHDKVYTYQHSTNSLYRGKTLIRAPAVAKLPCPAPIPIAKLEEDRVVPERLTGRKRGLG